MLILVYLFYFGEKVLGLVTVATAILHIWRGRGRYMAPILILLAVAGALFGMQIVVEEAPVSVAGPLMLARFLCWCWRPSAWHSNTFKPRTKKKATWPRPS